MDPPTVPSPSRSSGCCHCLGFVPIFTLLLLLAIFKALIIGPVAFLIILIGNVALIVSLYPLHVLWTFSTIIRTKKFGPQLKGVIIILLPAPIVMWLPASFIGSVLTGLVFGIIFPVIATFEAVSQEKVATNKFVSSLKEATWSAIEVGFKVVRDFKDILLYTYFSFMDGLLESQGERPIEIRFDQIPGCIVAASFGLMVDFPMLTLIVFYKIPVMLFKGWRQLIQDLIGRTGPFLESVCVPFSGLMLLLWPLAVGLAAAAGIASSPFFGLYASVIAYQENSMKSGLLYALAIISIFDEATNDFLYMREGSCFCRPKYRKAELTRTPSLPVNKLPEQSTSTSLKRPLMKTPSMKIQELKAFVIWENILKASEELGKELVHQGAILISDLEAWRHSKSKIVNIGLPSYVFLHCFIRSIKSGSTGLVLRDNVELTSLNRPEGRIFDWLFEPMLVLKEQIKAVDLTEAEEAYLYKWTLFCGDTQRINAWHNGGVPPADEVKRAQLEGISRRLHGFCLTLSRMPTYRRRFEEVVKALLQEGRQNLGQNVGETV